MASVQSSPTVAAAPRETFATKFGTVMALIGVAVGLGNVWRFPYMAGKFGGGAFLLLYLAIVILFGIPALMAEYAFGRYHRTGPLGALPKSGIPLGKAWGWLLFITIVMATSYYAVVIAWTAWYLIASLTGAYVGVDTAQFFENTLNNFWVQFLLTALVMVLCVAVLWFGIRRGVEKVSKVGMPILYVLLIVLIIRSVTLPGAGEGLRFYLLPDFSKINFEVLMAALGQAFFSLSLGGTFMVVYGSYISRETDLRKTAIQTVIGDTGASILAGFAVLPAVFAFGLDVTSGPPLTFITVPAAFAKMPAGMLFATLFFFFLFFAAYLSEVAAFEILATTLTDQFRMERKRALLLILAAEILLAIPSCVDLDFLLKNDVIWGSTMQPFGSALTLITLTWFMGRSLALKEVNEGNARPVGGLWFFWVKYVIPIGVLAIMALGLQQFWAAFFG